MSFRTIALLTSALALLPAAAQPATEMAAPAAALANSMLDVPIEAIAASELGCAVLDKDFPGLRTHAMYGFFKAMSLNQIAAMSHGKITPILLAQAQTDLSTLQPVAAHPTDFEDFAPLASLAPN